MPNTPANPDIPPLTAPVLGLLAVVALEALGVIAATGLLIFDVITQPVHSLSSTIALIVLTAIAAVFLVAIVRGIHAGQPWTRGATVVWQVLQLAAAVVILQGDIATPLGWLFALLSLAGLLLVFHPAVTARLRHVDRGGDVDS